ncbi:SDR family NAD(P)-dependent oxidoreductase [Bacillus sp. OK048]|uniref:SDR family NAD(P)-dependent oxidoreductase n=1 Tax=Bacillus sp. OK048 TaxID=1882761 RepID=UPI00088398D9|nr:SDR family NAD(P)-dependent oxidoreductase [Bacillus sp. OK048]SDM15518.1 3-oxoacyl-[acyl-carrier protein] reductase [Bacillus sp. OK048]
MRLKDKVAFVTGAGGPMGEAIALRFAEEGAQLVITDISQNRLNQTREKLLEFMDVDQVVAIRANVLNFDEVKEVVEEANKRFLKIDILVNVVGGIRDTTMMKSIFEIDGERWDHTMELNLKGTFHCTKLVAPKMMENGYGKIVNISTIHFEGDKGYADYGAAKAGVSSFTKTAAKELSPAINVNCIAPGLIQTSVVDRMDSETLEEYRNKTLLGRLGKPIDVANAALFLASDESAFITGHIIPVSGGIWPHL